MSVRKKCSLKPGITISFLYPRHNYQGVQTYSERRTLKIASIRDIKKQPIEEQTLTINPMLRRGRYLVTGKDVDTGKERSFYLESMESVKMTKGQRKLKKFIVLHGTKIAFQFERLIDAIKAQGTVYGRILKEDDVGYP